jgi:hypothetical protein
MLYTLFLLQEVCQRFIKKHVGVDSHAIFNSVGEFLSYYHNYREVIMTKCQSLQYFVYKDTKDKTIEITYV